MAIVVAVYVAAFLSLILWWRYVAPWVIDKVADHYAPSSEALDSGPEGQ